MSLPSRLLGANPSIQVSTLLSGSLSTPSAKGVFDSITVDAFESIQTVYLSSGTANSIDFTSIPSTYKRLQIRAIARDNRTPSYSNMTIRFNGDSGSNYTAYELEGDPRPYISVGASTGTGFVNSITGGAGGNTYYGSFIMDIYDYANTNWNTSIINRGVANRGSSGGGAWSYGGYWAGFWNSRSVITSITLTPTTTPFAQYSHFALYGVK